MYFVCLCMYIKMNDAWSVRQKKEIWLKSFNKNFRKLTSLHEIKVQMICTFALLKELNMDPTEVENLLVSCILDKWVNVLNILSMFLSITMLSITVMILTKYKSIYPADNAKILGFLYSCLQNWIQGHLIFALSVCDSVVKKNFNLGHNFWTLRDRDFIFGMLTQLMKLFYYKWRQGQWPWPWHLYWK